MGAPYIYDISHLRANEIFVHMVKHLSSRWIYFSAMARNSHLFIGLISVKAKG